MAGLNWDDLRLLAGVGRTGSFSGAAEQVGLSHSSVSRRMRALEASLGVRLFAASENKLSLTAAGEELFLRAEAMADLADTGLRQVQGRDAALRGPIRFATVDATARNLMPCLQRFSERHPEIELEILVGQSFASLTRSEADVLLRATNDPPDTYVGKCVAHHAFPLLASHALAERYPRDAPLDAYPWVIWGGGMTDAWMAEHVPNAHVVCRANTALMMEEAVRAGIGVGHLAAFGAGRSDDFVQLRPPDASLDLGIWLLTHRDLRRSARVRSFIDFLAAELREQRDLIEGRSRG